MATITAAAVKALREKTGVGMMDCKKALTENDGDMEASIDWLRKKGLSKAAKKAGRTTAEGLVGLAVEGGKGVVVEVNAETDFVARNEEFKGFVSSVAKLALTTDGTKEGLLAAELNGTPVETALTALIAKIGENMSIRRVASVSAEPGVVVSYVHNAEGEGLGNIGVVVALKSEADADKLNGLGKQIAMHIAAAAPLALSSDELPDDVVAHERKVQEDIIKQDGKGKPDAIIEKMLEGRMRKFYEENALLSQAFVMDGKTQISKVLEEQGKELGTPVEVAGFVRFKVGDGIEKTVDDFASEVNKMAGK